VKKKQTKRASLSVTRKTLERRERQIELSRRKLHEKERMLATLMSNLDGMVYRCRYDSQWTMEFVSEGCYQLTRGDQRRTRRKTPLFVGVPDPMP
jgi:hypothetical protein